MLIKLSIPTRLRNEIYGYKVSFAIENLTSCPMSVCYWLNLDSSSAKASKPVYYKSFTNHRTICSSQSMRSSDWICHRASSYLIRDSFLSCSSSFKNSAMRSSPDVSSPKYPFCGMRTMRLCRMTHVLPITTTSSNSYGRIYRHNIRTLPRRRNNTRTFRLFDGLS